MKDITKHKSYFLEQFQKKCPHFDGTACRKPGGCSCEPVAEMWAYVVGLVPARCQTKHLQEFSGNIPDTSEQVLPDETVSEARERLVRYIWGRVRSDEYDGLTDFTAPEWAKRSVLGRRRELGHSLVIHGEPSSTRDGRVDRFANVAKPMGRTLLASIVMREVLRMRLTPGHAADTYEWASFPTLRARVLAKDSEAISDYQTCDWLVVDNIHPQSRLESSAAKAFKNEKVDSIFLERIDQQLPTILVFQFDLNRSPALHEEVGIGIAQIVNDDRTLKINLSNPNE